MGNLKEALFDFDAVVSDPNVTEKVRIIYLFPQKRHFFEI
jgi:tetratricopeptide (TPR) repeat protein